MIVPLADRLNDVKAYYFVKKLEEIRALKAAGNDVINFGIGSPDLPPSEETIKALTETAEEEGSHGYQPYKGIPELREAIANWYKNTYNVDINPEHEILPLMGSKEGILHVTLAFVNPGEEVLVPDPGYPTYTSLSTLLGASVVKYDLSEETDWYPNLEELEKRDLSKVKLMWINYPHMPTGTPAKKEVFEALIAFAKKHKILLCHDNPYSLVLHQGEPMSLLSLEGAKDVAIELNSFSKSHNMAGWRIGIMLGAEEYISNALRIKSNIDSGMFLGTQKATIEALKLDNQWHFERNEIYRERRDVVFEIFDYLGFEYSLKQEGMFVWAKPKADSEIKNIEAFVDNLLLEKHIFFTPGFIFGKNGNGYMRASLCVPAERMKEALLRLKA